MNFHRYVAGSQFFFSFSFFVTTVKKVFLKLRMYLCEENALLLHDALYALGVPCSLESFVYEISFLFNFG